MKALLFLLLLVISSNGFGRHDGDHCEGKDAISHIKCDEGYHWLKKGWLDKNFIHSNSSAEGICSPCKSNKDVFVVPAEEAPEWLVQNQDWTKEPWTETDPDLNFYGILWANGSVGELFALGYCRFQRSWQKHKACEVMPTMMDLEYTDLNGGHGPRNVHVFFGLLQINFGGTIYEPVDERMTEFIGTIDQMYGLGYLTNYVRNLFGVYSYITIDDVNKDPNVWTQHWKNGPSYTDRDGKMHIGFNGPYYKIIDSNGKKTKYFTDYLKYSKGRLYTFDRHNNEAQFDIDTEVFIWKIIIAIIIGSFGAMIYYCLVKKDVLPSPKGKM